MNRMQLRAPKALHRRSDRARRASVAHEVPLEYSAERPVPRWVVVGTGILAASVVAELAVGLAVLA